jgi:multidrug efflux pump subunit AcrA (membrane-fusion protein)
LLVQAGIPFSELFVYAIFFGLCHTMRIFMSCRLPSLVWLVAGLALLIGLTGCGRAPAQAPPPAPTPVTVSCPVERQVTDYADYTARTAAVDSVEVRAHVWGYLEKVNFKEGALVKKGDVLFELDQRPYVAEVDRVRGQLEQAKASLNQAIAQLTQAEAQVDKCAANLGYQRKRLDRAKQLRPRGVISGCGRSS